MGWVLARKWQPCRPGPGVLVPQLPTKRSSSWLFHVLCQIQSEEDLHSLTSFFRNCSVASVTKQEFIIKGRAGDCQAKVLHLLHPITLLPSHGDPGSKPEILFHATLAIGQLLPGPSCLAVKRSVLKVDPDLSFFVCFYITQSQDCCNCDNERQDPWPVPPAADHDQATESLTFVLISNIK